MSSDNKHFNGLVEAGNPVGEVIAVERFLVKVRGLQPCAVRALVMFDDGSKASYTRWRLTTWCVAPRRSGCAARHGGRGPASGSGLQGWQGFRRPRGIGDRRTAGR